MKGQFMLIASVIAGIILIGTASSISEIRSQNMDAESTRHEISLIKNEVKETRWTDRGRIEDYLENLDEYESKSNFVRGYNCYNITLTRVNERMHLGCLSLSLETSPKIAWVGMPNDNDRRWNVFNFFPKNSTFYRSTSGTDYMSEINGTEFEMQQVEPPYYTVDGDETAPIILVNNPDPDEAWNMTWNNSKNPGKPEWKLKMPAIRDAEADKLIFWEDLYTKSGPDGDDWTDEIVRITYLTPETFRVAIYRSKGSHRHELFLKVESEDPLRGDLTYVKPSGSGRKNFDSEGYLVEDEIYFVN